MPAWHAITLRGYRDTDLPAIIAMQHRLAPPHQRWSEARAREELCDAARGHGSNVRVAEQGDVITGVAAWVEIGAANGEFYGAPFLATGDASADRLLEPLLERARQLGVRWIRMTTWPGDTIKERALERAGFRSEFSFIDLVCVLAEASAEAVPAVPDGLASVPHDAVDATRFAALYNTCFRDVPNAPAISPALAHDSWYGETIWPAASRILADESGDYQAFLLIRQGGEIDTVGTMPAFRGRGLARALILHAMASARAAGLARLTSLCASNNHASLALHAALGFTELSRRLSWQLDL